MSEYKRDDSIIGFETEHFCLEGCYAFLIRTGNDKLKCLECGSVWDND